MSRLIPNLESSDNYVVWRLFQYPGETEASADVVTGLEAALNLVNNIANSSSGRNEMTDIKVFKLGPEVVLVEQEEEARKEIVVERKRKFKVADKKQWRKR